MRITQGRSTGLRYHRISSPVHQTHPIGVYLRRDSYRQTAIRSASSSSTCPSFLVSRSHPVTRSVSNLGYIADVTFCGDWAGNSYATSGCPGTCEERLQDPKNFEVSRPCWDTYSEADRRRMRPGLSMTSRFTENNQCMGLSVQIPPRPQCRLGYPSRRSPYYGLHWFPSDNRGQLYHEGNTILRLLFTFPITTL